MLFCKSIFLAENEHDTQTQRGGKVVFRVIIGVRLFIRGEKAATSLSGCVEHVKVEITQHFFRDFNKSYFLG